MLNFSRLILIFIILLYINTKGICVSADSAATDQKAFNFSGFYLGDAAGCFDGGLSKGISLMGLADVSASLSTGLLGLWTGGVLFAELQNTHCSRPGTEFTGDIQVFDNIENGNQTYLFQLWYRQEFEKLWILAGLHDLNAEFLSSRYSAEYINSSFGIMPVASLNNPVSIFPNTALSFLAGYSNGRFGLKTGVYEGDPGDPEKDIHNLDFSLKGGNGLLSITEASMDYQIAQKMQGAVRFGFSYHSANTVNIQDSTRYHKGNLLYYFIADQQIISNSKGKELGLFLQAGAAPCNRNMNDYCFSAGLNYTGLFSGKNNDILSVAFAHASISSDYVKQMNAVVAPAETVFEFSYKAFLTDHIMIQPDLQYILNPGINPTVHHAAVAILRIGIIY